MRKALVVGINQYPNSPLSGCTNDADAIAHILERNGDNSVNFSVKKIVDKDVDTKGKLKGAIRECFDGDADIALFYFSGHGFIDAIGGYIVTPDYAQNDWGVSMQEILEIINQSKCRNKVVILDCCHSGFMGSITSSGQTAVIQDGVTILTASKPEESALESDGHGIFTALLLDALKGGASDVTGHITPGGIYAYIDKALGPWQQRPVFKTNVTRFSPIRNVLPQVDTTILRRITQYFETPEQEFNLNPSFEDTNSNNVIHNVIEPYADANNVAIFKDLQKLESVRLVVPCDSEHMYFAAMESKSCRLTSAGQHYWRLVNNKNI
ncbi:hypothetical protein FACS189427_08600 [Planctomycetales bacterium]|nr:hypothetical protein FACS189427_08600 [Planctomycetales bacterium]